MHNGTFRLNEVLGKLLGGLVGVTSERLNEALDDAGGEKESDTRWGFIH